MEAGLFATNTEINIFFIFIFFEWSSIEWDLLSERFFLKKTVILALEVFMQPLERILFIALFPPFLSCAIRRYVFEPDVLSEINCNFFSSGTKSIGKFF